MRNSGDSATQRTIVSDAAASGSAAGLFASPTTFFLWVGAYFVLQAILRIAISPAAELDEAEQLVLTQHLSWGYGLQGPLFTWLQRGLFELMGVSVAAMAVLKNALLAAIYLLVYACARRVTQQHSAGMAAAVFVFISPVFFWEAQRDLTHTVLAAALAAATLLVMVRLGETHSLRLYVTLGLCAGLGVLSKANFMVFLLGLLVAAWTLEPYSRALRQPRALLALAVFVVVLLPYALWMIRHPEWAFPSAAKFSGGPGVNWVTTRATGLGKLPVAMMSVFGLSLGVFAWVCLLPSRSAPGPSLTLSSNAERLILRQLGAIVVGLFATVLLVGASSFRSRWFQPVLIGLPVLAVGVLRHRLTPGRMRMIGAIGLATALVVLLLMPGHLWLAVWRGRPFRLSAPFVELSGELGRAAPGVKLMIAEERWLGGNLRLLCPGAQVRVPELPAPPGELTGPCLIVWNATKNERPPPSLLEFAQARAGMRVTNLAAHYVDAPYRHVPAVRLRLGFIQASAGSSGEATASKVPIASNSVPGSTAE
jgi:4-amino-4-deoxy-L-arabinose transferase-like glycosyltransferase